MSWKDFKHPATVLAMLSLMCAVYAMLMLVGACCASEGKVMNSWGHKYDKDTCTIRIEK